MQDRNAVRRRKTLDPKLDIVFQMLFGAEQNRELLISLLNAVLNPPVPIASVTVLSGQPERLAASAKSISLDLRLRLQNGEQVDVEMQSQRHAALRERALYYWARMYADDLQRGNPYTELRRCVVILITNFSELTSQRFHSTFQLHERHGGELLTDHLELHVLELNKLPNALERYDEPNLTLWGKFLSAKADEELEDLAMEHPVLKQAKAALDRLSEDEAARYEAESREMALLTWEAGVAKARREAEQIGHREGRAAGTAEVLLRQLTLKFGPPPANIAERLASASQEDLLRWSDRVLSVDMLEEIFV